MPIVRTSINFVRVAALVAWPFIPSAAAEVASANTVNHSEG